MAEPMIRRPLSRMSEKYRPRTVKMPDSLWTRFTDAALAEGESSISTFVRGCAVIGLEYRERDRVMGTHRGMPGMTSGNPGVGGSHTASRTAG